MTEAISVDKIETARRALKELLALKRLCARVHPIMHDVPEKGPRARGRIRKVPSGTWVVLLFEGASVTAPADVDLRTIAEAINAQLIALTQNALRVQIDALVGRERSQGTNHGVESLKKLDEDLIDLSLAGNFQIQSREGEEGAVVVQPAQMARGAQVVFSGQAAEARATQFCVQVNLIIRDHFAAFEKQLTDRLSAAIGAL